MAILDNPFNVTFSRSDVPAPMKRQQMYELTNLGRKEVENLEPTDVEFPIMAPMHHKAMSIADLNDETHMGDKKIEFILKKLEAKGLVKKASAA